MLSYDESHGLSRLWTKVPRNVEFSCLASVVSNQFFTRTTVDNPKKDCEEWKSLFTISFTFVGLLTDQCMLLGCVG